MSKGTAANAISWVLTFVLLAGIAGCAATKLPWSNQDLGGEHVSFKTSDGVLLRGHLYGHGQVGVILAHMYPADQSDWTDFARVLASHGYEALTFDFRGFTESEGESGTEFADRDLMAAYEFMRPRVSRLFIAGASLGSEAAILIAAHEQVAGIICISTPMSFGGLDVTKAIAQVRAPILFVTSKDDALVGGQPEILYRLALAPKQFETYPGNAHGTSILFGPYGPELQSLMLRFIAQHTPEGQ
jgi:dienelactone hydrolase